MHNMILGTLQRGPRLGLVGASRVWSRTSGESQEQSGDERVCIGACKHSIDDAIP